ncbi:MAG: sulfite exporter TauE/SafE family protein [Selenomonadaceae bacterium]|nr:sulfite exporter TauE/SafE family protein [Selenomonadaceae bacterium]
MESYLLGLAAHALPLCCVAAAALLQSLTGFGLAIVMAPLLMLFYDAKSVVALVLMLCLCGNLVQSILHVREANVRLVAFLYLGVLIGQPIGFQIFDMATSETLKLLINVMVLVSLLIMQAMRVRIRETNGNSVKAGVLAGITSVTTGMGGPPFLLYIAHTKMAPGRLRATCFLFFFLCNITSLVTHELGGYRIDASFTEFLYLVPGLLTGLLLGDVLYCFVPKGWLRQAIFVLLYATSLFGCAEFLFHG